MPIGVKAKIMPIGAKVPSPAKIMPTCKNRADPDLLQKSCRRPPDHGPCKNHANPDFFAKKMPTRKYPKGLRATRGLFRVVSSKCEDHV
jgi:hypothetical protein